MKKPQSKSKVRRANSNASFQVNEIDDDILKDNKKLIWAVHGIYFLIGLVFFIIGIIYLSAFYYAYSFTAFSTTLIAGLYIPIGAILMAIAGINMALAQTHRNKKALVGATISAVFFLFFLAIGIWGLSVSGNSDKLRDEVRKNILYSLNGYEGNSYDRYDAVKIDWLQSTFNCCGLNNYYDWQQYYAKSGASGTLSGGLAPPFLNQQNYHLSGGLNANNPNPWDNNQKFPVPDSCCVQKVPNCGKDYKNRQQVPNGNVNSPYYQNNLNSNGIGNNWQYYGLNLLDNHLLINLKGCLDVYLKQFRSDILFLSLFCFFCSLVGLALYVLLFVASYRLNETLF